MFPFKPIDAKRKGALSCVLVYHRVSNVRWDAAQQVFGDLDCHEFLERLAVGPCIIQFVGQQTAVNSFEPVDDDPPRLVGASSCDVVIVGSLTRLARSPWGLARLVRAFIGPNPHH